MTSAPHFFFTTCAVLVKSWGEKLREGNISFLLIAVAILPLTLKHKGPAGHIQSKFQKTRFLYAATFPPSLSILSRYVRYNNGIRRRMSVASLGEIGKVQGGKSISPQRYHLSLTAGIKLLQSVYIFLSTQSRMAVYWLSKYRSIKISWNI